VPPGTPRQAVDERLVAELDRAGAAAAHLLDVESEARSGIDAHALDERVEIGRDAGEDRGAQLGAVWIAMQLPIGRFVNTPARGLRVGDERRDLRI
jgi:hypothetical protein